MFGLLKLAAYGLLGYAIYEFVVGLLQIEDENHRRSNGAGGSSGDRRPEAARVNFTGAGQGQRVSTAGTAGETASHQVGRGVVAR